MDMKKGAKKINETVKEVGEKIKKADKREVKFVFRNPDAKKVCLAGDFNNWNTESLPMRKGKDGTWSKILKLVPGRYQYGFLADDCWIKDLSGSEIVANPFGTFNCVIRVE